VDEREFAEAMASPLPALYVAVLQATDRMVRAGGNGATYEEIGMAAWSAISPAERAEFLPRVLGAYVQVVHGEERMRQRRSAKP
jgi:hypothetical protein